MKKISRGECGKPIIEITGFESGFTLIEILIVLFLMTLILGMSTVFFAGSLPSVKLNSVARELSAVIRQARALARLNMEQRKVLIDLDNRTYCIEGWPKKNIPPEFRLAVFDHVSGEVHKGVYPIVFQPVGGAAGGAIILSDEKHTLRIEMDPILGAVVIKNG